MTDEEHQIIEEAKIYYLNHKRKFFFDFTSFLLMCSFIFYIIILFQN